MLRMVVRDMIPSAKLGDGRITDAHHLPVPRTHDFPAPRRPGSSRGCVCRGNVTQYRSRHGKLIMTHSLPLRSNDAHKGDFGRALLIGGSRGMAGAPALAGCAALRAGSGLVTIAVPGDCLTVTAAHDPCCMTVRLSQDGEGRIGPGSWRQLQPLMRRASSVGLGPGLSRSPWLTRLIARLYEQFSGPMVVDADALNALATVSPRTPAGPRVLTPHIGEFRRLIGNDALNAEQCRAAASHLARQWQAVIVLKGPGSLITDGQQQWINATGNPGMATGGAGDVLTGVLTSLLGQGLSTVDAAVTGVHLHGLAGDLARDHLGERGMTADDIARHLPSAAQQMASHPADPSP